MLLRLLNALPRAISADELVRQSGSSQSVVQMVPLEIELAEELERGAGDKVRLGA